MNKLNKKLITASSTIIGTSLVLGTVVPLLAGSVTKTVKNNKILNTKNTRAITPHSFDAAYGETKTISFPNNNGALPEICKIYTPDETEYEFEDTAKTIVTALKLKNNAPADALINIKMPKSVTKIKTRAFDGHNSPDTTFQKIVRIDLSSANNLTDIGEASIRSLDNLREINFGTTNSVISGNYSMKLNPKLSKLTNFENTKITEIPNSTFYANNLYDLNIPINTTTIGPWAYGENPNLRRISLKGTKVNMIDEGAFQFNNIEHFYAPDTVTTIGNDAFMSTNGAQPSTGPTYKFTTRWNVNLPNKYNTLSELTRIGIKNADGSALTASDITQEQIGVKLDYGQINSDYPTETPSEIINKIDALPIEDKLNYINFNTTRAGLEPIDFLRNFEVTNTNGELTFKVTLNSLYTSTDSLTIKLDPSKLDNKSTIIRTRHSDATFHSPFKYSTNTEFIQSLEGEITKFNNATTVAEKKILSTPYPKLNNLGVEIVNPTVNSKLTMSHVKYPQSNYLSIKLELKNILVDGTEDANASKILNTFVFFKKETETTFESTSQTNNVFDISSTVDVSKMSDFKTALQAEIDAWNATALANKDLTFSNTQILKNLGISVSGLNDQTTLSATITNTSNNTIAIKLSLNKALVNNNPNSTLELTYVALFGEKPVTTLTTTKQTFNFDLSANLNKDNLQTFKDQLKGEVDAWTTATDLSANAILGGLFGLNITNPATDSKLTHSIVESSDTNSLSVRFTLSKAYLSSNSTATDLTIDFNIIYKANSSAEFTTSLPNNILDLTNQLNFNQKTQLETLLTTETNAWTPDNSYLATTQFLKLLNLNFVNMPNTAKLVYSLTEDLKSNTMTLKLTVNNLGTNVKDLTQYITIKCTGYSNNTFASSLASNTLNLTTVFKDKVSTFEDTLKDEVQKWNNTPDTTFAKDKYPVLNALGLSITKDATPISGQQPFSLELSPITFDLKTSILAFSLTLKNAYVNGSINESIPLNLKVVFNDYPVTMFRSLSQNNILDLKDVETSQVEAFKTQLRKEMTDWNDVISGQDPNFSNSQILKAMKLQIADPSTAMTLSATFDDANLNTHNTLGVTLTLSGTTTQDATPGTISLNFTVWFKDQAATTFTSDAVNALKDITNKANIDQMDLLQEELNKEITAWNASKDSTFANSTILKWLGLNITNLNTEARLANAIYTPDLKTKTLGIKLTLENAKSNGVATNNISLEFTVLFADLPTTIFNSSLTNNEVNLEAFDRKEAETYLTKLQAEIDAWNAMTVKNFDNSPILTQLQLTADNLNENSNIQLTNAWFNEASSKLSFELSLNNAYENGTTKSIPLQFSVQFKKIIKAPTGTIYSEGQIIGFGVGVGLLCLILLIIIIVFIVKIRKREI